MKSLQEFKDEVCQEIGYDDYSDYCYRDKSKMEEPSHDDWDFRLIIIDKAAQLYSEHAFELGCIRQRSVYDTLTGKPLVENPFKQRH